MKYIDVIPDLTIGIDTTKDIFFKHSIVSMDEDYFTYFDVQDGKSLEDVAYDLYNDSELWWMLSIVNNFFDPIFDLPLSHESIQKIARDQSTVLGELDLDLFSTNYDILEAENDAKRTIKIIKPELKDKFITEIVRNYEQS